MLLLKLMTVVLMMSRAMGYHYCYCYIYNKIGGTMSSSTSVHYMDLGSGFQYIDYYGQISSCGTTAYTTSLSSTSTVDNSLVTKETSTRLKIDTRTAQTITITMAITTAIGCNGAQYGPVQTTVHIADLSACSGATFSDGGQFDTAKVVSLGSYKYFDITAFTNSASTSCNPTHYKLTLVSGTASMSIMQSSSTTQLYVSSTSGGGTSTFQVKGYRQQGLNEVELHTSSTGTLEIACTSSNAPTSTSWSTITPQIVYVNSPTYVAYSYPTGAYSSSCPVTAATYQENASDPTSYQNVTTVVDDSSNSQLKITYPTARGVTVSFYVTASSTLFSKTFGPHSFITKCGPDSTTISDTIGSGVTVNLFVEDSVNNYWEFDPFVSSYAACTISSHALIATTTSQTLTLEASGKYRIKITDKENVMSRNYKIEARTIDDGPTYQSAQFTIAVVCGPNSPAITDTTASEYTLAVADKVLNYAEFAPLVSTTNCGILSHQIVAEDGASYPTGIVKGGLTMNGSGNKYRVTVEDMLVQGTYKFKIKTTNDGGSEFLSDVKTIKVVCTAASVAGTVSDKVVTSLDLYVNYTIDYYEFDAFTTALPACPPESYKIVNSEGKSPVGVVSDVPTGPVDGKYQVKVSNKMIEQTIKFQIISTQAGGGTYTSAEVTIIMTCAQLSGHIFDLSESQYTLYVAGNKTFMVPLLTTNLTSCPITQQQLVQTVNGTEVVHTNGTTVYPAGISDTQDSTNFTIAITDIEVIANYNFTIKAIKRGGQNFSRSINVTVVCGNKSAEVVEDTAPATFSKYLYDTTNFYSFKNFTSTHTECPVISTTLFLMEIQKGEEVEVFPENIVPESPIYDTSSKLNLVKLINVREVKTYAFFIKVVLQGGFTYKTANVKKIVVSEKPESDALNMAPRMSAELETLNIVLPTKVSETDKETESESDIVHYFSPIAEDAELNTIKIEMISSGALKDLKFEEFVNNYTFHIEIDRSSLTDADVGDHLVKLQLTDDVTSLKTQLEFKIVIEGNEEEEEKEETQPVQESAFKGVIIEDVDRQEEEEKEVEEVVKEEKVYQKPVELHVSKISHDGAVAINFNQELLVPDLDSLSSLSYGSNQTQRSLSEVSLKDIIDLKVDTANYSVTLVNWTALEIKFQIDFDSPLSISKSGASNKLSISVNDPSYFVSKANGLAISKKESKKEIQETIPIQLPKGIIAEELEKEAETQEAGMKSLLILQIILLALINGSKEKLWAMISVLQIAVYLPIYAVDIPANVLIFLKSLRKIAEFKIVSQDEIFGILNIQNPLKNTKVSNTQKLMESKYSGAGFASFNMLENLTYYIIILAVGVLVAIIALLMSRLKGQKDKIVKKAKSVRNAFMWNGLIRTLNLTYLKQFVNFALATQIIKFDNDDAQGSVSSSLTIMIGFTLIAFPFWAGYFLIKNRKTLYKKKITAKYQSLYLGLKIDSDAALLTPMFFLLRRALFVMFATTQSAMPYLQVQLLVFSNSLYIIFIGKARPHLTRKSYRIEMFNEFVTMVICYHLFVFTQWAEQIKGGEVFQYNSGTSFMVTVGGMMLLNLIFTFREIYQPLKLKVYTWWYLKKLRKVREREEIELKAKKERREERKIKKIKEQEEQQIKHIEEEKAIIDRLFQEPQTNQTIVLDSASLDQQEVLKSKYREVQLRNMDKPVLSFEEKQLEAINKRQAEKDSKARIERKQRNFSKLVHNLSGMPKKVNNISIGPDNSPSSPDVPSPPPKTIGNKFRSSIAMKNMAKRSRANNARMVTIKEQEEEAQTQRSVESQD